MGIYKKRVSSPNDFLSIDIKERKTLFIIILTHKEQNERI